MNVKFLCAIQIFFCEFFGLVCFKFQVGNQRRKQANLERFDNTCGLRNSPIIFEYSGLKNVGTTLLMNSTITVKEDILDDITIMISLERCKNKENLDTCEHFYDYKSEKLCTIISADSALWTPLFSAYEPTFRCPLLKNVYRATNSSIDVSAFLLFPVENWYWRVQVEEHEKSTNRLIMCIKAEAHVITV